jgi:hypothetical protein
MTEMKTLLPACKRFADCQFRSCTRSWSRVELQFITRWGICLAAGKRFSLSQQLQLSE